MPWINEDGFCLEFMLSVLTVDLVSCRTDSEESTDEESGNEEAEGSDSSYEEGSYDGRHGNIVYQCKDDEAIAKGIPGAKMFDQNIRETYVYFLFLI